MSVRVGTLNLEHRDSHAGLVVGEGGDKLGLVGGNGSFALDGVHDTPGHDTKRTQHDAWVERGM